jgi:glycogen phosphorylase
VDGRALIETTPALKRVCEALLSGRYSDGDTMRYRPIVDSILNGDWFMVGTDFAAYATAQNKVSSLWTKTDDWTQSAITNSVRMGWFSSDRTIKDYARDIWNVPVA